MNTKINIELKELDKSNYRDILNLKVAENQSVFVASNAISLAQALFHPEAWYRGIYNGDTPVGFVMLELDMKKPEYFLWRYMIDERYQSMGYGFKAMELVIKYVKSLPGSVEFYLSYVAGEGDPKGFYEKLGFVDTGEVEAGEIVMKLDF